jgi:hypothetical protein
MGEVPTGSCYCERVKYEYAGNPLKKVSTYLKYIPNCVWLPVVRYLLTPLPRSLGNLSLPGMSQVDWFLQLGQHIGSQRQIPHHIWLFFSQILFQTP